MLVGIGAVVPDKTDVILQQVQNATCSLLRATPFFGSRAIFFSSSQVYQRPIKLSTELRATDLARVTGLEGDGESESSFAKNDTRRLTTQVRIRSLDA